MHAPRDLGRPVVVASRTARHGERNRGRLESDFAVLVLDVELERREPVLLEIEVLVELPRERCERHRDVDAAQLDRQRPRAARRGGGERRDVGDGLLALARPYEPRANPQCARWRTGTMRRRRYASGVSSVLPKPDARETARSGRWVGTASTPGRGPYRSARRIAAWSSPIARSGGCSTRVASASIPTTPRSCSRRASTSASTATSASSATRATRSSTSRRSRRSSPSSSRSRATRRSSSTRASSSSARRSSA